MTGSYKTYLMNTRLPGKFLQKRLSELNNALFFTEGDALIKLPNHLVTAMHVNEDGDILFVLPKPAQDLAAFDAEFPARLDVFKKGKPFGLKVRGKGHLIIDAAEIKMRCAASKQLQQRAGNDEVIMVRVSIQYVDYTGQVSDSLSSRIMLAGMQLSEWLFSASDGVRYAE